MPSKWVVPDSVFFQACEDFEARRVNNGCWFGGKIPDSVFEIKRLYNLDDNSMWVVIVENIVSMMAISYVASVANK